MIFTCLTIDVRPGSLSSLEEVFRRHRVLERAAEVEGCQSLYLTSDAVHEGRAHVIGVWDDGAAYQRWLDHPGRQVGAEDLRALAAESWDPSTPGEVWEVVHAVVRFTHGAGSHATT